MLFLRSRFRRENPGKNLVDVLQLALQIKCAFDLRSRNPLADLRIAYDQIVKIQVLSPRAHGVPLHKPVGILARNAAFDQVQQQLAAENKTMRALKIRLHARRINEHRLNQVRGFVEQVVRERGGIRNNDALSRGV